MGNKEIRLWFVGAIAALAVGTFVNVRAVQNTDLIKECTTPGTACYKLASDSRAAQLKATREGHAELVAQVNAICKP